MFIISSSNHTIFSVELFFKKEKNETILMRCAHGQKRYKEGERTWKMPKLTQAKETLKQHQHQRAKKNRGANK